MKQPSFLVPESTLLLRLKKRDELAFQWFYDQYAHVIYGFVLTATGNTDVARQLAETIFVDAWNELNQFDSTKTRLLTWLLDRTRIALSAANQSTPYTTNAPNQLIEYEEETNLIDPKERILLNAVYFQGHTVAEIALASQESASNLHRHLRAILQSLKFVFSQ